MSMKINDILLKHVPPIPTTARKPQVKEQYWFMRGVEYSRPITIGEALGGILHPEKAYGDRFYGILTENDKIHDILKSLKDLPEILKTRVIGIKGFGSSAVAFETDKHKIMKLSHQNHFPQNRPIESFDVPIEASGSSGDCFFYLEKKLDVMYEIPKELEPQFNKLQDDIRAKGYDLTDFHPAQTGYNLDEDKFLLVDPQCAIPHPLSDFEKMEKYAKLFFVSLIENVKTRNV